MGGELLGRYEGLIEMVMALEISQFRLYYYADRVWMLNPNIKFLRITNNISYQFLSKDSPTI